MPTENSTAGCAVSSELAIDGMRRQLRTTQATAEESTSLASSCAPSVNRLRPRRPPTSRARKQRQSMPIVMGSSIVTYRGVFRAGSLMRSFSLRSHPSVRVATACQQSFSEFFRLGFSPM